MAESRTVYKYLPVIGDSYLKQKACWWKVATSDGIFPYKYGLGSFHYLKGRHRSACEFPQGFHFFGDSGGFSVSANTNIYIKRDLGELFQEVRISKLAEHCTKWEKVTNKNGEEMEVSYVNNLNIFAKTAHLSYIFVTTEHKIKQVIRHKFKGKLLRIATDKKEVTVTSDHSLAYVDKDDTGRLVLHSKPSSEFKVGHMLLEIDVVDQNRLALSPILAITEEDYDDYVYDIACNGYFIGNNILCHNSVVTQNAVVNPVECYEWQKENCNVGVILDIPPYLATGTAQFGGNAAIVFKENLEKTIANVQAVKDVYDPKSAFEWWGVIQGETPEQREQWYNEITKIHKFTGYALSPKPSYDWRQIVSHMLLAAKKKIKRIHILQISSPLTIMLTMFINKKLGEPFEFISFDSSTPLRLASIGEHFTFNPETIRFNRVRSRVPVPLCDCELCQQFNHEDEHWCARPNVLVRSLHIIRAIVELTNYVQEFSVDTLAEHLSSRGRREFKECDQLLYQYQKTKKILSSKEHKNYIRGSGLDAAFETDDAGGFDSDVPEEFVEIYK